MTMMSSNLGEAVKDDLCTKIGTKADPDLLETMINAGINCLDTLSRNENVRT